MYLPIFYQDPVDHEPLLEQRDGFRHSRTGLVYPLRDGIPVFLPQGTVEGPNARYQALYDQFAPFYDLSTRLYAWLKGGDEAKRRRTYLELLELEDEKSFLEVSVGTGATWPYLNRKIHFYGLDLSARMLARCQKRVAELKLRARLCQALAERLPYPNSSFDSILHVGGINFFSDPAAALQEMARVAKRGTRVVVVDETEELARRNENRMIGGAFFKDRPRKIEPPVHLVPAGMREIEVREICNGDLYLLSFRRPQS
jgi:ubiquinone/menaquinone biosynthesis C-methylase UbiE